MLLVSLVGFAAITITLLPALLEQLSSIITQIPDWLDATNQKLQTIQNWAAAHRLPINLKRVMRQLTWQLPDQVNEWGDETLSFALNAVGGLTSLLLTLVLTLYLLLDGKRVWETIFRWLPLQNRDKIRRSLENDFHSYFIGQATISLILGTVLSLVFFVLHVPYSLLAGFTIGAMALIPFGDTLGYLVLCLLLAAQSPGLALTTVVVAILIDQFIDQVVAPRILGNVTGLKPIWVIFALLLGTKVFGLPGLLLAVPIASFINTILDQEAYLESNPDQPKLERDLPEESQAKPKQLSQPVQ